MSSTILEKKLQFRNGKVGAIFNNFEFTIIRATSSLFVSRKYVIATKRSIKKVSANKTKTLYIVYLLKNADSLGCYKQFINQVKES